MNLHTNLTLSTYGFAFVMSVIAIVPGLNYMYSGHGGIAWLILPLVLPVALLRLFFAYKKATHENKPIVKSFAIKSLSIYVVATLLVSVVGSYSIEKTFGLELGHFTLWSMFLSPFGLFYVW